MDRPQLETARLALRKPVAADSAAIIAAVGDWEVAKNLSLVPHPYGDAEAQFFLDHVVPADWVWAVTRRGDDELLGVVGLSPAADGTSAELGYWLGRSHWGQGIATEAAAAVIDFAFGTQGFARLTSGFFEDNPASGRVLAKLGFTVAGHSHRPCLARDCEVPAFDLVLPRSP